MNETRISPYNTAILATLRANMNIQYVTSVYAVLAYLTSYLCKAEHSMSELMKKAAKIKKVLEINYEKSERYSYKKGTFLIMNAQTG